MIGELFLALASGVGGYDAPTVLNAIREVETGGLPNRGIGAVGDNGKSIGPYQIGRLYWIDSDTSGEYQQCLDSHVYSEKVISRYMRRYANAEWLRIRSGVGTLADVEKVCRIHNGGPRGYTKKATVPYWNKILNNLK